MDVKVVGSQLQSSTGQSVICIHRKHDVCPSFYNVIFIPTSSGNMFYYTIQKSHHCKSNVGFLQRGAVIRAVASHCHNLSLLYHCAVNYTWNKRTKMLLIKAKRPTDSRKFCLEQQPTYLSPKCACLWVRTEPVLAVWARSCQCVLVQSRNTRRQKPS